MDDYIDFEVNDFILQPLYRIEIIIEMQMQEMLTANVQVNIHCDSDFSN